MKAAQQTCDLSRLLQISTAYDESVNGPHPIKGLILVRGGLIDRARRPYGRTWRQTNELNGSI
jgi:hypothetical protein